MIYLWVTIVTLAIIVGYGAFRLNKIDDEVEQSTDHIRGLAGDIVALTFVLREMNTGKSEPAEEEVA